jgi:ABC-type nitrate/sulfonate/bicarbonate transport system permease component
MNLARKTLSIFAAFYSSLIVIAVWEGIARSGLIPFFFLPPLSVIASTFATQTAEGVLVQHALLTIFRAVAGFVIAVAVGVTLGIGMARFKLVRWFFDPIVALGLPTPTLTLVPAFILWFGIGHEPKILLVALSCVCPMTVSTFNGARNVNPLLIWSARMMGTPERKLLWRVVIPAATPYIFNGMQVALPISLIVAFVFEMVAGGGGLGFLEIMSARFFRSPELFSALFAIMLIGFAFDRLLLKIRSRVLAWFEA